MGLMVVFSFSFSLISMLVVLIQPLSLGFLIMLISIVMSVIISFLIYSWYGFMLFLVYIGGLLIMFMYIISLVPNLIFFSKGLISFMLVIMFGFFFMNFMMMFKYMDVLSVKFNMMEMKNLSMGVSSLVMSSYNFIGYVFLGVLLLLILISVVKICYYCEGPLRVFKYK
uniref:NADH dehydrogenase subunit 6 n=1 Tax=Octopus fitchi TaxID=1690671 RepID=UPI0010C56E45|nr:NADH dehydrogenase subunit 6 [Octopus fitchi]QBR54759.1 NADH dehydrogenase subunit 6 [Octopus fitchi]